MTVPNLLTILRILLTPLLVWLLLGNRFNEALTVFFIAGMTDGLDGLIARVFHQKSKLGAYLDPLADKILLVTSFLLLGYLKRIPLWLVIVAVSRDAIIMLGLVSLMFHQVQVEIHPVPLSKLTTLFQLGTILAALSSQLVALPHLGYTVLFATTAVLSVISGVQYISIGIGMLDSRRGRNGD
jgi:cardiolipin synthase (CMP-forming)